MIRLMNAAVMPREGNYALRRLTPAEFAALVQDAHAGQALASYIGYPNAADVLSELCGVPIPLNRESTPVEDGDTLLIARLVYRVDNPAAKGQVKATVADYEFFIARYTALEN